MRRSGAACCSKHLAACWVSAIDTIAPMNAFTCAQILAGDAPADTPVVVKGWVRTRRDSKAGISFVHVSDGSCFHPVQAVVPNTLANYADEVARLTAGCSVAITGTI